MKKVRHILLMAALIASLAVPASAAAPSPAPPQITVTQTTDAMRWAVDNKLIPQTVEGSAPVTHQLIAETLYRLGGSPRVTGCHFSDLRVGTDGWDAARWAVDAGALFMYDDGAFAPQNTVTRMELARAMRRYAHGIGSEQDVYRSCASWALDVGVLAFDADGALRTETTASVWDFAQALYNVCAYYRK